MPRGRSHPPVLKRFGQHFLNDRSALADIADAALLTTDDVVVEIGPGRGALTDQLLDRAGRVVAIEIDKQLTELLRKKYAADTRITIVEGDVLDMQLSDLVGGPFAVVGNVPYYITTPILFHALRPPLPTRCVFLVQREVAERIVSPPGSREYGALSVNIQAIAKAEIVRIVPPGAFSPPPKVDSAVVRITPSRSRWFRKPKLNRSELSSWRFSECGESRSERFCAACGECLRKKLRTDSRKRASIPRRGRKRFLRQSLFGFVRYRERKPSSSIAMFTARSATSDGTESCTGAKLRIP
jgi:16S rRNA (adenine1518-N6/adenine1519-N6)-dimethyltransferase